MSLAIDTDRAEAVLLTDGWHKVKGQSFTTDAYEFTEKGRVIVAGGQVQGIVSTAAGWTEPDGTVVACPLTAVLAVKWNVPKSSVKARSMRI